MWRGIDFLFLGGKPMVVLVVAELVESFLYQRWPKPVENKADASQLSRPTHEDRCLR